MIKHRGVIILIMSLYISTYDFKKDFAYITVFCSERLCRRQGGVVFILKKKCLNQRRQRDMSKVSHC